MKEIPMIFNGEMVRAILSGQKTQTRRMVNPKVSWEKDPQVKGYKPEVFFNNASNKKWQWVRGACHASNPHNLPVNVGDRIYVRENWKVGSWAHEDGLIAVDYQADNFARREWLELENDPNGEKFLKLWTQSCEDFEKAGYKMGKSNNRYSWEPGYAPTRWRPSIHMPKWAARVWLEVASVKVERLQEISEADAKAEGVPCRCIPPIIHIESKEYEEGKRTNCSHMNAFKDIWDSIYDNWKANPWVWVIKFKMVTK